MKIDLRKSQSSKQKKPHRQKWSQLKGRGRRLDQLPGFEIQTRLVIALLVLALGFLFYRLEFPSSVDLKSAVLGYQAWGFLKTGRDLKGSFWPLFFNGWGKYFPPIVIYLEAISTSLLGLNSFGVNFIGAFFGFWLIYFSFLLVQQLEGKKSGFKNSLWFLGALVFSPWIFFLSRTAIEITIGLTWLIIGSLLIRLREKPRAFRPRLDSPLVDKGLSASVDLGGDSKPQVENPDRRIRGLLALGSSILKNKPRVGLAFFVLSFYSSFALWPFLLAFFPVIIFYQSRSGSWRRNGILVLVFFLLTLLPVIFWLKQDLGFRQFLVSQSFLVDKEFLGEINFRRGLANQRLSPFLSRVIHNKLSYLILYWGRRYLGAFNFEFLFSPLISGSQDWGSTLPRLFFWQLPLGLLGLYLFLARKKPELILIFWLVLAPLPALIWPQSFSSELFFLPAIFMIGLGIRFLADLLAKKEFLKKTVILGLGILLLISNLVFWQLFFDHSRLWRSLRSDDCRQLISQVLEQADQFERIVITDRLGQPHAYWLFYSRYSPLEYQEAEKTGGIDRFGLFQVARLAKFEFRSFDFDQSEKKENWLYVGFPEEFGQKGEQKDKDKINEGKFIEAVNLIAGEKDYLGDQIWLIKAVPKKAK